MHPLKTITAKQKSNTFNTFLRALCGALQNRNIPWRYKAVLTVASFLLWSCKLLAGTREVHGQENLFCFLIIFNTMNDDDDVVFFHFDTVFFHVNREQNNSNVKICDFMQPFCTSNLF